MTDVGMSVFEHSLAFAETETMLYQMLGVGLFRSSSAVGKTASVVTVASSGTTRAISDAATSLTGPHLLDRLNVPTEVLVIALLSCCNSLTANIIALFNRQRSLRLINTAVWGVGFMSAFVWGFVSKHTRVSGGNFGVSIPGRNSTGAPQGSAFSTIGAPVNGTLDMRSVSGLLHFPTVCIVGFVPHLIVLLGISICVGIYLLALILTAVSLDTNPFIPPAGGLRQRLALAHENLQAAIQVRGIQIKWDEDFYTALLRTGFMALTAASEAVFLNEGRSVEVRQFTWLEEDRLDEIEASSTWPEGRPAMKSSTFQISETYGLPAVAEEQWESGYAKERKMDKDKDKADKNSGMAYPNTTPDGVGAIQRTTRFYLLFIFMRGIYYTIGGWILYGAGVLLDRIGVTSRPRWLRRIVGKSLRREAMSKRRTIERSAGSWNNDLDLDDWWGTADSSGPYIPPEDSEDTTSVISMSSAASTMSIDDDDESEDREMGWESEPEGRRTPTQDSPDAHDFNSRESTPAPFSDTPLDPQTLARLLNPPDQASREEARILARHLAPQVGIMTRSRYRHELEIARSRVLLAGRTHVHSRSDKRPLTQIEESEVLESLILSRRQGRAAPNGTDEQEDASPSGPVCVVCQSQARTIIAWPCRCLCVCEDCRVSLALNNFSNCVTCRRQVNGFVRLWVP